jgi:photosystem II stability/assembly factor-like uncharacterized protein
MKKTLVILFMLLSFIAANAQWQKTNGPEGASHVYCCAGNNGEIFAFLSWGYVYLSKDTGASWQHINPYQNFIGVTDFMMDGDNIWISTSSYLTYNIASGIFLSTDNGITWENKSKGLSNGIKQLAIQDNKLYAATGNGLVFSTDYGDNWTKIKTGIPITPEVIDCIYLNDEYFFIGTGVGIYKSTDKGETWVQKNNGLPKDSLMKTAIPVGRIVEKDSVIFAYLPPYNSAELVKPAYLCRSTDNGENWEIVLGGDLENSIQPNFLIKGDSIYCWNYTTLYLSTDNGETWDVINDKLSSLPLFYTLDIIGNTMLASTKSGIYISTDYGKSWLESDKGISNLTVYDIAVRGDNIYTASEKVGVSLTTDDGETWKNFNNGLPEGTDIKLIATDGDYIFVAPLGGNNIFMSSDNGNNWNLTPSSFPATYISDIIIMKGNVIASSSTGTYISSDLGGSWVKSTIIDTNNARLSYFSIDGDNIYAGSGRGVFISTDNGLNWYPVASPARWNITAITASEGIIYISDGHNIYAKADNFAYWYILAIDLTFDKIMDILIKGDNIIVGTTGAGVFISTDAGLSWNQRNEGLPILKYIWDIKIKGEYIYAAISGSGVYKAKLEDIITDVREENAQLEHSTAYLQYTNTYPIPASDIVRSTVYWNSIYNIMDAQIDIYNMYGMKQNNPEISIEKQADYKANIVWNCSGYSAGVYFIRVTLGGETMAVPVLINRGN